ncbi:phage portal protein [Labrys sp. WJW]|nr:phage portal protein [Labrys sp. WJW]
MQAAGRTLVKRARFLVENNGLCGNAVDVWAGWAVGDGITPNFAISDPKKRKALKKKFKRWCRRADADGQTGFSGLQEKIVREAYIAGEVFVRRRRRRRDDMPGTVPMQIQVLPSEMLDLAYNDNLPGGNVIRMGIEFDKIGRRVAYHFWRVHPDDTQTQFPPDGNTRSRVPAEDVLHVFDGRQGGQIRGVPKMARAMVRAFIFDIYDDAELDRKKTAALYAGFVEKQGEDSPIDGEEDEDGDIPLEPGAIVELNRGEKMNFSQPADVGGSYEPFMYRTTLYLSVALGVPYAYLTGDCTKGNFSNVRTDIQNFRRRVSQYQANTIIPQALEPIVAWWAEIGIGFGYLDELDGEDDFSVEDDTEWLPPHMEYIDPNNDVTADIKAVRAGFKSRTSVIAARGGDREGVDDDIERENADADRRKFIFDSDPRRVSSVGMTNAVPAGTGYADPQDENPDPQDVQDAKDEAAQEAAKRPEPKPAAPAPAPAKPKKKGAAE